MTPTRRTILGVAGALLGLMIVFPPYWVMYVQPEGNLHTGVGFHPIWNRPRPADAFETLHGYSHRDSLPGDTPDEKLRSEESRLARSRVGFNKVGFTFQVVVLGILTAVAYRLFGRPRYREDP